MIRSVTCYYVQCYGCNLTWPKVPGIGFWTSREELKEYLRQNGWSQNRFQWYCPTCSVDLMTSRITETGF